MANKITATLHDSDGNSLESKTYSVQDYINDFNAVSANYPEYTVNAVEAIADYGHYALEFLAATKGWTNDSGVYNGMFKQIEAVHNFNAEDLQAVKDAVAGYAITVNELASNFGVSNVEVSLNLDSETSLYFYFTVTDDVYDSFAAFEGVEPTQESNVLRKKSNGIPAHKLDEAQELSFTFLGSATVLASA